MTKVIHDKIVTATKTILGMEMEEEVDIAIDRMTKRVRSIFFKTAESLSEKQLEDIQSCMKLVGKISVLGPKWEMIFISSSAELEYVKDQLMIMPSVPMDEIDYIMSKFVEYASRERDKGNKLLDESLL